MTDTERSRRRAVRRWALFVLALGLGLVASASTARADSPAIFGWWSSQNVVPPEPIPVLVPGQPSGVPGDIFPDLPAGGFEVANAGPGDTAYAAIGYFTSGQTVQSVVLSLAADAADLPNSKVEACPLTSSNPFTSADAGPISAGPVYDCAASVPGVVNSSKRTVSFAAGSFVRNGYLGIAIVAVGTSRMVFDAPGPTTVQVVQGAVAPAPAPSTVAPVPVAPSSFPVQPSTEPAVEPAPVVAAPQPATVPAPSLASPATSPPSSVVVAQAASSLVGVSEHTSTVGVGSAIVGVVLILVAVVGRLIRNRRILTGVADRSPAESGGVI